MAACAVIAVPNFCRLVYYHKKTMELSDRVCLPAAATERYGGAGTGKTSSAILQAVFEAEKLQSETELQYHYMRANYDRWQKVSPWKLKGFKRIERSVKFWKEHPEYIPYLVSTVEIRLPNGQRSMFVSRAHLKQQEWLPICFALIDEAGAIIPQDEHRKRPADIVLFFRLIRHFGIRCVICEQKEDGVLINVRVVLGGQVLCLGQTNALLPNLMIDIISFLKRRLPKMKSGKKLGHLIERLQYIAMHIGFRIWDTLYIRCKGNEKEVPNERIRVVCTNKMPCQYDDMSFSELYLAKDKEARIINKDGGVVTPETEMGECMLRTYNEQQESLKVEAEKEAEKAMKRKVSMKKLSAKEKKLDKEAQPNNAEPK